MHNRVIKHNKVTPSFIEWVQTYDAVTIASIIANCSSMILVKDAMHLQQYVAQQTDSNKNGNMYGIGFLKKNKQL